MGIQWFNDCSLPQIDGKRALIRYIRAMNSFSRLPPGHSLVETEDGSFTLFSEAFQEACHSTTGAKTETVLHYLNGCKVRERISLHDHFTILEVGFGLGIGFLTTYELLPKNHRWTFISLELDRNLLEWFKETQREHEFLKTLQWEGNLLKARNDNIELIIILGDARVELPEFLSQYPQKWNAIYQDAFSPKRNPALWTKEWFNLLKAHSHEDVVLSTYSASTSIRKSLHETGWGVRKGEKFGPKRTSTRATLSDETDPEILLQMERSPVSALTDLQIDSFKLK